MCSNTEHTRLISQHAPHSRARRRSSTYIMTLACTICTSLEGFLNNIELSVANHTQEVWWTCYKQRYWKDCRCPVSWAWILPCWNGNIRINGEDVVAEIYGCERTMDYVYNIIHGLHGTYMDELPRLTIQMDLAENLYFNMAKTDTTFKLWAKLPWIYEKKLRSSKLILNWNWFNIKMRESERTTSDVNTCSRVLTEFSNNFKEEVKEPF